MIQRQTSIPEMLGQSADVITNPSVQTFERYERRGTLMHAVIYVAIAAVIGGLLGLLGGTRGLIGGLFSALINFFIFTGMVYYLGKQQGGTGTFDEVAYTFSLFSAPLAVVGALITFVVRIFSWVPVLNILVGLIGAIVGILVLLVQVYFAYLAVQSSMNIRDQNRSLTVLISATVVTILAQVVLAIF